jgi:hypothetical protein
VKGPLIEPERDILPNGGPIAEVPLVPGSCCDGNGCGGNASMPVDVTVAGPATLMLWRSVKFPVAELEDSPRWCCEGMTLSDHDERRVGGNGAVAGTTGVVKLESKSRGGVSGRSAKKGNVGGPEGRNGE